MLFCGFAMTRITKLLRLPTVTAYVVTGILIGPYCLNLIPSSVVSGMDFLSDIALAFIAFSTGEYFRLSLIKQNGVKAIVITAFEVLASFIIVFVLTFFAFGLSLSLSLVISSLATTTSPASTVLIIRQTKAKGDFVNTLMPVIALDLIVGLLAFSVCVSVAGSIEGGSFDFWAVISPLLINLGVMFIGAIAGLLTKLLIPKKRSNDNRLIILLAMLFIFCGICAMLGVSPLLGCMAMGMTYINLTDDDKLFRQLNYFSPAFMLLFFVKSGVGFDLGALVGYTSLGIPIIVVAVCYLLARMVGKYLGAFSGCALMKKPKKVRNHLGLALFSQAGVSIALASMGARVLGGELGVLLQTIIVAAGVLYELIGPVCAKLSLSLSGSYSDNIEDVAPVSDLREDGTEKTEVEILTERIKKIRDENGLTWAEENESAFTEAADDYAGLIAPYNYNRRRRGR
ncbi:MAG: cation:proton antiporter [Clostridia bacterium]|nr:cation:proton antiporter [Clostridia bacterium]